MKGTLKNDGLGWYVEYIDPNPTVLDVDPISKFVLKKDNLDKIESGEWEAEEGKKVNFEVYSLPQFPFYEADINGSDMRKSIFNHITSSMDEPKEKRIRYRYYVYFSGSSKKIICDEMVQSETVYYFYVHVPTDKPRTEYINDGYSTRTLNYEREKIAQFPIINTAIYEIEKFEE